MAAHSFLRIGGQLFLAVREGYLPELAASFRDVELVSDNDRYEYVLTASKLRDRLDILGISSEMAMKKIADRYDLIAPEEHEDPIFVWLLSFERAVRDDPELNHEDVPEWLNGLDARYIVRLCLDHVPPDTEVALDLGDVVSRGYIQADPDLCAVEFAQQHLASTSQGPIVVLTEGSTDAEFLQAALRIVYPHLADYIRFPDFQYKAEGGVGPLVKNVKAFATAGIGNRIIALFDNDTAAKEALQGLHEPTLPSNITVKTLPDLELANNYPTLGPSGSVDLNVNGMACSIEFFFGKSILSRPDGSLSPVQWTGYSQKIRTYQGELLDKRKIQDRFRKTLAETARAPADPAEEPWSSLKLVLDDLLPLEGDRRT